MASRPDLRDSAAAAGPLAVASAVAALLVACGGGAAGPVNTGDQVASFFVDGTDPPAAGQTDEGSMSAHGTVELDGIVHDFDDASFCEIDPTDPVPVRATFGDELFVDPALDALLVGNAAGSDSRIIVELGEQRWDVLFDERPTITGGVATWDQMALREVNQGTEAIMTITVSCG